MPLRTDRPATPSVGDCLDRLEALLDSRGSWFGLGGSGRRDEARQVLHEARALLAKEVGRLAQAQAEADAVLRRAQEEARRLTADAQERTRANADADVVREAEREARDIRAVANREADEMRRSADVYALGVFERLDAEVSRVVTTVRRGKAILGERTGGGSTSTRLDNEKMASV